MDPEIFFRIALVVILSLTMPVGVYHRRQAARTGERISHQAEGYLFAVVLRLAGLALWLATLAWLLYPASVRWAQLPLPEWVRWSGVVLSATGPLLMYWTMSSLGKNLTDTVVTRANASLVTHGPYRWVRHPFYVTAAVLMFSVTLLSASAMIGFFSAVILGMLALRTPKEEQMLIERFGDNYRDYMAHTGRFFPRLG